jgi:hypothetical protein
MDEALTGSPFRHCCDPQKARGRPSADRHFLRELYLCRLFEGEDRPRNTVCGRPCSAYGAAQAIGGVSYACHGRGMSARTMAPGSVAALPLPRPKAWRNPTKDPRWSPWLAAADRGARAAVSEDLCRPRQPPKVDGWIAVKKPVIHFVPLRLSLFEGRRGRHGSGGTATLTMGCPSPLPVPLHYSGIDARAAAALPPRGSGTPTPTLTGRLHIGGWRSPAGHSGDAGAWCGGRPSKTSFGGLPIRAVESHQADHCSDLQPRGIRRGGVGGQPPSGFMRSGF